MEYNPSIWSVDHNEGRRDYVASVLKAYYGKPLHMKSLAKIIGDISHEPVPEYKSNAAFHNTRYRKLLSTDIDALNFNPQFQWIIISDNLGVRICNAADAEKMFKMERKETLKKLAKLSILARKAGRDGQITITKEEIESIANGENHA